MYTLTPPITGQHKYIYIRGLYRFIKVEPNVLHSAMLNAGETRNDVTSAGVIEVFEDHWIMTQMGSASLGVGCHSRVDIIEISELLDKPFACGSTTVFCSDSTDIVRF